MSINSEPTGHPSSQSMDLWGTICQNRKEQKTSQTFLRLENPVNLVSQKTHIYIG